MKENHIKAYILLLLASLAWDICYCMCGILFQLDFQTHQMYALLPFIIMCGIGIYEGIKLIFKK